MKNKYNIVLTTLAIILSLGIFSSCVKSRVDRTDFSSLKPLVQIPEGGNQNFGAGALNLDANNADSFFFHVNYAAKNVAPSDITVTLAKDPAAIATYNADPSHAVKFQAFPDSIYSFKTTSVTIKAGQNFSDAIAFVIYPAKVDPTQNYMLPISIKDAAGNDISGNFGTIYYHLIGNPLAGNYNWDFTRYQGPSKSAPISGLSFKGGSTAFVADDPNTVEVATGYYTQPRYVIHFDNNGGVLSNFTVDFNQGDLAGAWNTNITVATGPHFTILDPVNKIFQIEYQTATRYVVDKFYK